MDMRTNFEMQNQNITMVKGDTLSFNIQIMDENGEPMEVDSVYMTCKKIPTSDDKVFQKSLEEGISQADGMLTVRVSPADTQEADAGEYFYDVQIGAGDDIFTIMIGILTLEQDVTF
jgi:hypothetical protein